MQVAPVSMFGCSPPDLQQLAGMMQRPVVPVGADPGAQEGGTWYGDLGGRCGQLRLDNPLLGPVTGYMLKGSTIPWSVAAGTGRLGLGTASTIVEHSATRAIPVALPVTVALTGALITKGVADHMAENRCGVGATAAVTGVLGATTGVLTGLALTQCWNPVGWVCGALALGGALAGLAYGAYAANSAERQAQAADQATTVAASQAQEKANGLAFLQEDQAYHLNQVTPGLGSSLLAAQPQINIPSYTGASLTVSGAVARQKQAEELAQIEAAALGQYPSGL